MQNIQQQPKTIVGHVFNRLPLELPLNIRKGIRENDYDFLVADKNFGAGLMSTLFYPYALVAVADFLINKDKIEENYDEATELLECIRYIGGPVTLALGTLQFAKCFAVDGIYQIAEKLGYKDL